MLFRLLNRCLFTNTHLSSNRRQLHLCAILRNNLQTNKPKMDAENPNNTLVWVDCEMTGLNFNEDQLLEIAVILTDSQLNEIDSLPTMIIKTDESVLNSMNDWCKEHHGKSGLTKACLESTLTIETADQMLHDFLNKRKIDAGILAGNSIANDRIFLRKWCPKFCSLLHYRLLDVSTLKELVKRWYPSEPPFPKDVPHRALDDIRLSINELKFYREKYFIDPSKFDSK